MNRRTPGLMLAQAIPGFLLYKTAEALSPTTLCSYHDHLKLWLKYIGDVAVECITSADLCAFLVWLRQEYQPQRITGNTAPLAAKTVRNYWVSLSAFFTWAADEFGIPNPMKAVPAPKFVDALVQPFTREEIEKLVKAAEFCNEANTTRRRRFVMRRPTARRDRALILVLLDTGLRASEVCALDVGDVDLKSGQVRVKHGDPGGAKGGKGRVVYLGKAARRALWRYLSSRADGADADAPLFVGKLHRRMDKGLLRQLIVRLGEKAGVAHAHPHRFRHTFALTYLRSGGDVFTLQALLGHRTLEMVQHYARLAQVDIEHAHRRASPVDNWHL
jgi:integrase/recombinase XerD